MKNSRLLTGISMVICGEAGQGIQSIEQLMSRLIKISGYHVFATKEYMSRVRGGANSTEIRLSAEPVKAYVNAIDILVPLSKEAFEHVEYRIDKNTRIIAENKILSFLPSSLQEQSYELNFTDIAREIGKPIFSNIVAVGVLSALVQIPQKTLLEEVRHFFEGKDESIVSKNLQAAEKGYEKGIIRSDDFKGLISGGKRSNIEHNLVFNGAQAIGLGALAGGCDFISSYPMSPSTAVLVFLAKQSKTFNVVVEQAEDEISAVNMALGAWYAGAKALVTTSGGGFALMEEGISLAGITETPLVIHIAQRPGPATGLPTRTEQGDLELVTYAGHGEFPRVILAPGNITQGFFLARKAFEIADTYQVPVFLLTDQYYIDSYYDVEPFDVPEETLADNIVKTKKDYRRYHLTDNGVSPRGIPGNGEGFVCIDSDEHDEEGRITEDFSVRIQMMQKRMSKSNALEEVSIPPEFVGPEDYETLIICWGSNYNAVLESLSYLEETKTAMLHFTQVFPIPAQSLAYLEKAQRTILVENNYTGQFGKLLKLYADFEVDHKLLKYNGLPFAVEELVFQLDEIIHQGAKS